MKALCAAAVLALFSGVTAKAQDAPAPVPSLTVRSNLVEVPALVRTKSGEVVFALGANDFALADNGVPQKLTVDAESGSQPLALAIVVETGGAGARHLQAYGKLDAVLERLTDNIHNRFSLEKRLDALIDDARAKAGIFGLIYIDLDNFKHINDSYGHQTGDAYLQAVAVRTKTQLRSMDTLARLGGDEFAVLVPVVRNRTDVEDIALRIERSFDAPFRIEEISIRGSASIGIALYPQDGSTRDALLNFADAVMYSNKNARRQAGEAQASKRNPSKVPAS